MLSVPIGTESRKLEKAAGETAIPNWLPLRAPVESVTAIAWVPAVLKVAVNVCLPASAAVKV